MDHRELPGISFEVHIMKQHDISHELFEITDDILESHVPAYQHQLINMNMKLPYQYLDSTISKMLRLDTGQKCIWVPSLEEVMFQAQEDGLITDNDLEDVLMYLRLDVKMDNMD